MSETRELIARLDLFVQGLDAEVPDAEELSDLEARLAALQLRLAKIADERDPAGNATMLECHRENCPDCAELLKLAGLLESDPNEEMFDRQLDR